MNEVLMKAVVESLAFLGLSSSDVIDEDSAVAQMEQLGAVLNDLSTEDKKKFARFTQKLASEEERAGSSPERIVFLRTLADNLGLTDEV